MSGRGARLALMAEHHPLVGVDDDAAGRAACVGVQISMPRAWHQLRDGLWLALTGQVSEGGRPDEPRRPGHEGASTFSGDEAARVEALVELAQQGDVDAFGQLYERSVNTVYRYVYVRTGDRQLSEDLTSETFIRALRNIGSFTWQGRDIVAWFLTIARNLIIDSRKSARFRLEITTDELLDDHPGRRDAPGRTGRLDHATPEQVALQRHQERELVEALRGLTSDQAECVVLRFMEGLSLAECAEVLGRKENAVKQLQLRAIRALRKELGRAG